MIPSVNIIIFVGIALVISIILFLLASIAHNKFPKISNLLDKISDFAIDLTKHTP